MTCNIDWCLTNHTTDSPNEIDTFHYDVMAPFLLSSPTDSFDQIDATYMRSGTIAVQVHARTGPTLLWPETRLMIECTEAVSLSEAEARELGGWLMSWADRVATLNRDAGGAWLAD